MWKSSQQTWSRLHQEGPQAERVFNPSRETRHILSQAQTIGAAAQQLCEHLFVVQGRVSQRTLWGSLWGIVGLARRYPRRFVNAACARAIVEGVDHRLIRPAHAYAEVVQPGRYATSTLPFNPQQE